MALHNKLQNSAGKISGRSAAISRAAVMGPFEATVGVVVRCTESEFRTSVEALKPRNRTVQHCQRS